MLAAAVLAAQSAPDRAKLDLIFSAFTRQSPGCAVGVSREGKVVFEAGYGLADLERSVPITPATVFESGSVAKQFTAAALMLLAQTGVISLDDPLRKFLPELPDYGQPLTIRHVIHHVSGLREWRPLAQFGGFPEGTRVYSNEDLLALAARQHTLNFPPGANYTYSNTGFNIAAILIERALKGKTFPEFTKEAIFDPLGMTHTRWRDNFRALAPNRAVAYKRVAAGWELAMPIENIIGAGGMLTTVGDLLLWNDNFRHARIGGRAFVHAQHERAVLADGRVISYAAGLNVTTHGHLREVSHGGATGGYRTWLGRYPEKALSVAVLCNAASITPAELGRRTADAFLGTVAGTSPQPAPSQQAVTWLPGAYRRLRDHTILRIEAQGRGLVLRRGPAGSALPVRLIPLGNGRFALDKSTEQLLCEQARPVRCRSTADDASVWEQAELVTPSPATLAAYAGDYSSDETQSTMRVTVTDGVLSYAVGRYERGRLTPTFEDTFQAADGAAFRFWRTKTGTVNALSTGSDRVWDLRFTKVHQD